MAEPKEDFHWQPPAPDAKGSNKIGWLNDVVADGEKSLTSSFGYKDMNRTVDMISGRLEKIRNESRSKLSINRGKRSLRELIADISNIRAVDAFSSENSAFKAEAQMLNKIWKSIYFESQFPKTFKRAVQWMAAGGCSYLSPVYRNTKLSARASRKIVFDAFSIADAIPFQLPESNEVQGAYAWTLIRFMPEFEAHSKFPDFQHLLHPVAKRRYSGDAAKSRLTLAERFRFGDSPIQGAWAEQYDEIRWTFVRDLSRNEGKKPKPMGEPGALHSYVVPFEGMEIPDGTGGMRKATEEDCYLYPNLRLFISQKGMPRPMYDGPAFSWHGMFPLVRISADEWPWEPGYSLARDIFSIEEARGNLERGLDQTTRARFDPALIYDKTVLPRKTAEAFDPYEERGRLGLDGPATDQSVRPMLPGELLNIPDWGFKQLQHYDDTEDYILGMNAMQNLAKAKASNGDAAQKAMEEVGPVAKDISYGMEAPMAELILMVGYEVAQYYPPGRAMQLLGANGVTRETFDLDPESLVPSHGPQEFDKSVKSVYTRMQRSQMFLANFQTIITPGSLHGIVQTEQKLLYMQLQRAGFMISSETVAKAMDIPNWGVLPGNTEMEKWQAEQEMKVSFAAKMQSMAGALQPPGAGGGPAPPGKAKPGRPPSGNKPPEMKTKGSAEGPRATVTES